MIYNRPNKSFPKEKKKNIHRRKTTFLSYIKANWVWLIPLAYLFFSTIGIIQAYSYFRLFNINIFNYITLNDFLLSFFRHFFSLTTFIIALSMGIFSFVSDKILLKSYLNPMAVFSGFMLVSAIFMTYKPFQYIINSESERCNIITNPDNHVKLFLSKPDDKNHQYYFDSIILLGTTEQFFFLYDLEKNEVLHVPSSSIVMIKNRIDPIEIEKCESLINSVGVPPLPPPPNPPSSRKRSDPDTSTKKTDAKIDTINN